MNKRLVTIMQTLAAVFFAGMVSLIMELSLLREFVFVAGSTAVSNSFIISIFLVGLTCGAYLGSAWSKRHPQLATRTLVLLQIINVLTVWGFVFTKGYFQYKIGNPAAVMAFFGAVALVPSLIGGMSFS